MIKLKTIEANFEAPEHTRQDKVQFVLTIAKNIEGQTPFDESLLCRREEMVKIFLTHFDLENFVESQ